MNILLVGVNGKPNDAVSNIMINMIEKYNTDIHFYTISLWSSYVDKPNLTGIELKDYHGTLMYKLKNKICSVLKIDKRKLGYRKIYKTILKNCKNINFDYIIATPGNSRYIYAAYKYAKRNGIKLKIIYFDPFDNHLDAFNRKARLKDEQKWLKYADNIFYNTENLFPTNYNKNNKFVPFNIPIFVIEENTNKNVNNYFVYGGSFYKKYRNIANIYKIGERLVDSKYKIKCFSNMGKIKETSNIEFYDRLSMKDYYNECINAKGLIYIGNDVDNYVSSKYLECIGMKKIIIGINVKKSDIIHKYPYYFDYDDNKLIEKIDNIDFNKLKTINPLELYPDRNPKKLFDCLFNSEVKK